MTPITISCAGSAASESAPAVSSSVPPAAASESAVAEPESFVLRLFEIAAKLGYSKQFIDQEKYAMYDDHIPFIEKGIPAADLIDFDYPWWHTLSDTADKLSEESLQAVYRVLFSFILEF